MLNMISSERISWEGSCTDFRIVLYRLRHDPTEVHGTEEKICANGSCINRVFVHAFDEDFDFPWNEICSCQTMKIVFASFYVSLVVVVVAFIQAKEWPSIVDRRWPCFLCVACSVVTDLEYDRASLASFCSHFLGRNLFDTYFRFHQSFSRCFNETRYFQLEST